MIKNDGNYIEFPPTLHQFGIYPISKADIWFLLCLGVIRVRILPVLFLEAIEKDLLTMSTTNTTDCR